MLKILVMWPLLAGLVLSASPGGPMPLWPKEVPGGKKDLGPEKDMTTPKDNVVGGKPVIRIGNVTEPSLRFYGVEGTQEGPAVVVFPGGGYRILALDLEGTEICQWLNSIGVNAVLVKYRVPEVQSADQRYLAPLQDAQRALGMVRSRAAEWHIDPQRIGVLGFSAGGHLAAVLSGNYEKRSYDAVDSADRTNCRPDFTVLIYPAYLAAGPKLAELAPEVQVAATNPPAFVVQTEDDPVHAENSLVYYRALKDAKVPAEMHLFSTGGHGYGMRPDAMKPVTEWPKLLEAWFKAQGIVKPAKAN